MRFFQPSFLVLAICLVFVGLNSTTQAQDSLGGTWQGEWQSCTNGHHGRLSAEFCRVNFSQVRATFRGTFAKIIPFRYRPVLDIVHEEPGLMIIEGNQRLPLMGSFQYQAIVTGNDFRATYRSRRDQGVWNMRR